MFERAILVHYHEIGLKGRNRARFEQILRRNLQAVVGDLAARPVERIASRLLVPLADPGSRHEALDRVTRVPGVSYAADALVTARDMREFEQAALEVMREAEPWEVFRVEARRSMTDYPISSQDVNVEVGSFLVDAFGRGVDLDHPDATCFIEIVQGDAYVYSRRVDGPGGLPVGSAGKVVALISSGIDSPVASWRIARRGAVVVGVHFSGAPVTDDSSERQVHEIAKVLQRSHAMARVYSVPFGSLQREISLEAPPALRVLLYRRLMVRVAEEIAEREGALALVTGESLGQVASQTLENITAVDDAASLPVLRPLSGDDKQDIIEQARAIGTYEISVAPGSDCCTLFMPRSPATHATVDEVRDGESGLDMERMVRDALGTMTHRDFECPAYDPPSGDDPD